MEAEDLREEVHDAMLWVSEEERGEEAGRKGLDRAFTRSWQNMISFGGGY